MPNIQIVMPPTYHRDTHMRAVHLSRHAIPLAYRHKVP